MSRFTTILLSFSIIFWLVSGTVWKFTDFPIYYIGTSQMMLVSSLIIYQFHKTKIQKFICSIFVFCSFNGFMDELFFDPLAFEINEYITFSLFVLWNVFKCLKK